MSIHKLSPTKVKYASPGKHEDGDGLRLVVSKSYAKKWVLRYTLKGKRHEMGLGRVSEVDLKDARVQADRFRKAARKGIDPLSVRDQEEVVVPDFTVCAARYIRAHRKSWSNIKHAKQWARTLKTYARPVIGSKPVDLITTEDVLSVLSPIWSEKTETAKRIQGRIENVLDFASARGYRDHLNPARWRGHLDKLLPKPSRVKTVTHHPAMPYEDVSSFMLELSKKNSVSSSALQILILTATRTSEVLEAKWSEIDLEESVWTIPADRMKAKREHRVPLSGAVVDVLKKLPVIKDSPYVFPSVQQGKHISNMALLQLMRGMGYGIKGDRGKYVPHGFRSSFRDWAGEVSVFPSDVAEMALAHTIKNKVEAAYRRGDLFEKRRKMMQAWADYVVRPQVKKVVDIRDAVHG